MRSVIYPKAGKIALVKYNSDGTLSITDNTKWVGANGVVQSIKTTVDIKSSELPDGNSDFPMGVYDTGKDGTIEVTMSSFQPALYAALLGQTVTKETTQNMWSAEEKYTIPSSAPYTVTLENSVVAGGTIVVLDNTGSPFASVSSDPAASQYTVSGATLTFNAADAAKEVFCTYELATMTSEKTVLPASGVRPVLHCIITTKAANEDETSEFLANIIVDKAKSFGAMSPPPQQREPAAWTFSLKVLKPRAGYNPVYWRFKTS